MSFEKMMKAFNSGGLRPRGGYEAYYEGRSRLDAIGINLPPKARILELQAPWAKMAVDVITEVLIPAGFISSSDSDQAAIDLVDQVWQANDMDSQFNQASAEAIAVGAAYWVIAPPDDEHPLPSIRALDSKHARVRTDWTGKTLEGVAVYRLNEDEIGATYYTPDGVRLYVKNTKSGGQWRDTGQGRLDTWGPSIIPMFNRARLGDKYGRSDIAELAGVIDAASRTLTAMQVGQEVAVWPMRFLFGENASELLGNNADALKNFIGGMNAGPEGGDVKQLSGADTTPLITAYKTYALQVSAMTGIPPAMMGVAADNNPTSAEALQVAKDRLIMRAENKQRQFSDSLERLAHTICTIMGVPVVSDSGLEVRWRSAATPSTAAQAAFMLQAQSQGVVSPETVRSYLNLTPQQAAFENSRSTDLDAMAGVAAQQFPTQASKEEDAGA